MAFRDGDSAAFGMLVNRHHAAVFNFIVRFTGHRQKAQDVLQDTWLKVIRGASEYTPKAKFTTWLYTVARNLCVDSARRDAYRQTDSLDAPVSEEAGSSALVESVPTGQAGPDREAHNMSLRPRLLKALQALPEEQREVFLLREYSGIAFKDIAEVTGVPEGTVKSRMRYALEGLRKTLNALGVDGDMAEEGRVTG